MTRFLQRLTLFLTLALVGYLSLFAAVMALNRNAIGNCRLAPGVDSVIVGDSHTAWAIDAAGIAGVQNISHNAEGYKYTYAKLRHLLHAEPGVRRVYVGFSFHNLSSYYDDYIVGPTFRFFVERYLSVLSLADYVELVRNDLRHAPELFIRVVRNGFSSGLRGECTLYGRFADEPMTAVFNLASTEKRIGEQYFERGNVRGKSQLNVEYLGKLIELARQAGVELVMLNTPLHSEYLRRVPREFREAYEKYVRDHDLLVFDFGDLQLTDTEFLPDGDHTNYRGAALASRRFAEFHGASVSDSAE
jgi:hypothetical protein